MKMETIHIFIHDGRHILGRYGAGIGRAILMVIRRQAQSRGCNRTKASHEARARKELCQAASMAQVQYGRYFNR